MFLERNSFRLRSSILFPFFYVPFFRLRMKRTSLSFFEAIFQTVDGWALVARKQRIDKILPQGHRFTVIRVEAATSIVAFEDLWIFQLSEAFSAFWRLLTRFVVNVLDARCRGAYFCFCFSKRAKIQTIVGLPEPKYRTCARLLLVNHRGWRWSDNVQGAY